MRDDVSNMVDSQQKFSSRTQREMGETKKMVKKVEGMTRKVVANSIKSHPGSSIQGTSY